MPLSIGCSSLFHAARSVACGRHPPLVPCRHFLGAPFFSLWSSPLIPTADIHWSQRRAFASHSTPSSSAPPVPNPATNGTAGIGWYQRYEQWLQSDYPTLYKLHRLTVDGSKWCYSDLKTYFWLSYGLRKGRITLNDLNTQELFIYIQCAPDVVRIVIIAILLSIPISGELVVLLALVSPKLVLTRHFWSDWQSQQFQTEDLRRNERKLSPRIVDALRQHHPMSSTANVALGKQLPLTVAQLVAMQTDENIVPSSLASYTPQHRFFLKRTLNLPFWATDGALLRHVALMRLLDARMAADQAEHKIVDKLSVRDLQTHLYLRNLNFSRMTVEQMRSTLVQWLNQFKSPSAFDDHPLLYAHAPVLTQANSADLDRWMKKKRDGQWSSPLSATAGGQGFGSTAAKDGPATVVPHFIQSLDNLDQWKRMGQRSAELAKRSADAVKPMLRKGTAMAAERLKDAGKAMKRAAN